MKKIRVVQVVPMLGPGGAERVVVDLAKGLDRQRFDVGVISIWDRVGCDLERVLDDCNARVEYLGKGRGFDGRVFRRLHHALRDFRPDVVHTHLQVLRYALPSLLLLKPDLMVHTVHNLAEREVERRARFIQKCAFHHGVVPISVSKEVSLSLKRLYGIAQSRVIANGIQTSYYACPQVNRHDWRARAGFTEDQVLFVSVARFEEQKNHALLLEAFAQGPAYDPRAQLVLVGDGSLRAVLQAQAASLGIAPQVHFLGVRSDVPDLLGASDVFAMSSDWEGNPLSVMEAMASGLPIVCTAVGGVPDLLANGREGFLVQRGNERGMANSMAFLLRSKASRLVMGAAGALRAKEYFDVSRMVHAYERLYERAIESTGLAKTDIMTRAQSMSMQSLANIL
jgi:glycosyltransferase involved in cell wall biosynthesis